MRYGLRVKPANQAATVETVMSATRSAGFGDEVKRRIILGTYALSAGYYDAYYGSAQKVRTLIQRDFAAAFTEFDVLVSPTTPTTAFPLGARLDNPLAMYLADIATIPVSLAGVPALSLPAGLSTNGLPVGLQIIAPIREDARLYRVGAAVEAVLAEKWGGPLTSLIPPSVLDNGPNCAPPPHWINATKEVSQ
jgi:aspartyl-tRNA(Asn)/glutamyl-tRNA(Gln) amidotransferase subunit A